MLRIVEILLCRIAATYICSSEVDGEEELLYVEYVGPCGKLYVYKVFRNYLAYIMNVGQLAKLDFLLDQSLDLIVFTILFATPAPILTKLFSNLLSLLYHDIYV